MKKSLRDLGLTSDFLYPHGRDNAITDVPGIKVGHKTIIKGDNVRTGVTVVLPPVDFTKHCLVAGGFILNADGEVTGLHYIFEEARLLSPIFLTNTLAVGDVFTAVIDYYKGSIPLPIIGECWDGYLNDIYGRHVKAKHVFEAIENAKGGKVQQGNVGAGTGMTAFGFKAGIGAASRKIKIGQPPFTYNIGVLVNNNLAYLKGVQPRLRIKGVDVSSLLENKDWQPTIIKNPTEDCSSSAIFVLATDIPLTHQQLNRLAKRVVLGMGRVGVVSYTGSGDFILAFSTANKIPRKGTGRRFTVEMIDDKLLDCVFEATIEASEEALLNSLLLAEDMEGRNGSKAFALPIEKILKNLRS